MHDDELKTGGKNGTSAWGLILLWINRNRPAAWVVVITIGLVLFLNLLPEAVRAFFWRGIRDNALLAVMLFVFVMLAISLVWSTGQRLDALAFLFFNLRGPRSKWLDYVMLGFTQLGSGVAALVLALVLFSSGLRLLAYELVLGTLTLWLLVELLKALVRRSRPFIRLAETRIVGWRERGLSFPSGHTSQVFFLATLIVQYFQASLWTVGFLYAMALLVGITRMYVGAHYPRDVIAGAILGSVWGVMGGVIYGRWL
jgi:membrane-associated phospholipid phosphatase